MASLLILKATPWKDSDLLIRALSFTAGTNTYKLKHIHSKTQSRLSLAEPGVFITAELYKRTEIPVITEGRVVKRFGAITSSLTSLNYYWFCLFCITHLIPANSVSVSEHRELFRKIRATFEEYDKQLKTLPLEDCNNRDHSVHRYPLALICYVYTFMDLTPLLKVPAGKPSRVFDFLVKFIENSTSHHYQNIQI